MNENEAHLLPIAVALAASTAFAAPMVPVLKFKGAIGVDPLTAENGVDVLNIVRGD